jgi:hypothetical protein
MLIVLLKQNRKIICWRYSHTSPTFPSTTGWVSTRTSATQLQPLHENSSNRMSAGRIMLNLNSNSAVHSWATIFGSETRCIHRRGENARSLHLRFRGASQNVKMQRHLWESTVFTRGDPVAGLKNGGVGAADGGA